MKISDIFTTPLPPEKYSYDLDGSVATRQWKGSGCLIAIILVLLVIVVIALLAAYVATRH